MARKSMPQNVDDAMVEADKRLERADYHVDSEWMKVNEITYVKKVCPAAYAELVVSDKKWHVQLYYFSTDFAAGGISS